MESCRLRVGRVLLTRIGSVPLILHSFSHVSGERWWRATPRNGRCVPVGVGKCERMSVVGCLGAVVCLVNCLYSDLAFLFERGTVAGGAERDTLRRPAFTLVLKNTAYRLRVGICIATPTTSK